MMAPSRAKRFGLLLGGLLLLGLTLGLPWTVPSSYGQGTTDPGRGLDLVLLIDNSESMNNNDPEDLRIRAARFLVDYINIQVETGEIRCWLGVASFGGILSDTIPLSPLPNELLGGYIVAEQVPNTDFRPPLQFAERQLDDDFGAGKRQAVILFSDGRPQLSAEAMTPQDLEEYFGDDSEGELANLVGELQSQGVEVFVLGLGEAAQEVEPYWTALVPAEHFIHVSSTTDLADLYHNLVNDLLGLAGEPGELLPSERRVEVEVEPFLEQITFSFMKSEPSLQITLTDSLGQVIRPAVGGSESSYYQIHTTIDPEHGPWWIQWQQVGQVQYWVDRQYATTRVELQAPSPYTSDPITITASLLRRGRPVVDPDLFLRAVIDRPDGSTEILPMKDQGEGRYVQVLEGVPLKGIYEVSASAWWVDTRLDVRARPATVTIQLSSPLPTASPTQTPSPTTTPTPTPSPTPSPTSTPPAPPGGIVIPPPVFWLNIIFIVIVLGGLIFLVLWFRRQVGQEEQEREKWQERAEQEEQERERWQERAEQEEQEREKWQETAERKEQEREKWQEAAEREKQEREKWQKTAEQEKQEREKWQKTSKLSKKAEQLDDLAEQAEKALLEDKKPDQAIALAGELIQNALDYYKTTRDEMTFHIWKGLDIIRDAVEDPREWVKIISERFLADDSGLVQHALARALKKWWSENADEAAEVIYELVLEQDEKRKLCELLQASDETWPGLAEALVLWWAKEPSLAVENIYRLVLQGRKDLLRLLCQRPRQPAESLADTQRKAQLTQNICEALYKIYDRQGEPLAPLLKGVADAFGAADAESFVHAKEAQAVYAYLASLAARPCWPTAVPHLQENALSCFQELAEKARQKFEPKSPAWG